MADEKKEDIKEGKAQEPVQKAPEAQAAAPAPEAAVAPQAAAPAEAKKEEKVEKIKKEKPANCGGCNKSIKKKRWYYRDGKYFCSKRCFKSTIKKEDKKEEPKA